MNTNCSVVLGRKIGSIFVEHMFYTIAIYIYLCDHDENEFYELLTILFKTPHANHIYRNRSCLSSNIKNRRDFRLSLRTNSQNKRKSNCYRTRQIRAHCKQIASTLAILAHPHFLFILLKHFTVIWV